MPYTLEQLEAFVSSPYYDPHTAGAIAAHVPALKAAGAPGELISPGVRRIRGNLCNVHGKYGPCDKALSGAKKPKGRARKPAAPKKTDAQRAAERDTKRSANVQSVAKRMADTDTGLSPSGVKALTAFATGQQPDSTQGAGLAQMGLAERASDGSYRMTPTGRAVVSAMQAGDYQRAVDAVSRGTDAQGKRTERATAAQARQAAAAKRQQDAAGKRAATQMGRELAKRQPAKAASGGSKKKPEKPAAEKPLKVAMPRRVARGSAPSVGGVAGSAANKKPIAQPKPEKPAKAPTKQVAPALVEAAQNLSDGKELSEADAQALIRNGLARLVKGELVLTAAGQRQTMKSKEDTYGLDTGTRRTTAQRIGTRAPIRQGLRTRDGRPQPTAPNSETSRTARQGTAGAAQRIKGYEPGQLCPYCTADLALPDVGWYRCGSCGEMFYADDTDSDYEDYHARRADRAVKFGAPPQPASMPTARVLKPPREKSFRIFKDARGAWRWVAQSSTAYQDRDREIVSTKALADDVAFADETGSYGPLRWWHTPGLDLGDCDFNAMHGRVLIESGTFRSAAIAQKVAAAAGGLEISLGFLHLPSEPDADGVFHHIRRFERSLVPRGKASNRFTAFTVKETRMFDPTKVAALKQLGFSDDDIVGLQAQAAATEKAATDQGVAFKADEPAALPDVIINGVTYKAFPPKAADEAVEAVVEEDAIEDMPIEEEAAEGGLTLSPEDIAAIGSAVAEQIGPAIAQVMGALDLEKKVAGHVQGMLAPFQQAQATKDASDAEKAEQIAALNAALKDTQTKLAELTGDQPSAPYRASAAKDTALTDATMLAAAKQLTDPNAADPWADIRNGLGLGQPQ